MRKIDSSVKLRSLHIFAHVMLIPAIMYGSWEWWIASYVMWFLMGGVGISLGFHRYFSHKSFECEAWFENVMLFLGTLTGGGTVLSWVGIHRLHHSFSDTDKDPHGPVSLTPFQSYTHQWKRPHIPMRLIRDLLKKKNLVWTHRHYWKILFVWGLFLLAIDPLVFLFIFCVPIVFAYHTYAQVNTFCHMFGYKNYNNTGKSTNIPLLNLWAFGEGYHNNHHKFPWSYRIGLKKNEFDPCAWLLEKGLMKSGNKPNEKQIESS